MGAASPSARNRPRPCCFRERSACGREAVAQNDVALYVVEHRVHQRQPVRVLNRLHPVESFAPLELLLLKRQVEKAVGAPLDVAVGGDEETARAGRGVLHALALRSSFMTSWT